MYNIKDFILYNLKSSNFSFNPVIKYLLSSKYYKIFKYKNIKFYFIYSNHKELNLKLIKNLLKRCYIINPNKIINIYIILTEIKRYLPNKIIKPININGGFTITNESNIFIIRNEEYPKVILHEILHHNINIDNNNWSKYNIQRLKNHFKIHPKTILIPNEAIIELWATIYHLKFISNDYQLDFNKLLEDEIKYSLFKSYQLLNLQKNNLWIEQTNAYCYIIFKTILLYNLKEFLKINTFPYNPDIITDFLIKNSKIPIIKKNPTNINNNSLRIMIYSDL
jgi:hypothetical protein